ncbi:uncharacterized protein GLRG_09973 [Colletotrichum graminicola M1.001]|uniref:Uncharacterized protein n=1 Tax=Colletotrichum graminicola (strain M1.001 / M2 / FGSC 10212) TaxID=645133 RepID=E3QVE1_COLGM|nr:uncharacterized protein GLRG_09973 [Colletotrichum graminicola M1.001]EFQ34829.1 hypothetical protein GLRG_09973 [Colletotrichum graminicola M1.001]
MPSLKSVKLSMDDDEKRFPDIRMRHRDEAAQAIRALSLPALTSVDLDFFLRRQRNERAQPPVLHNTGVPDPLSSSIFELSLNLVDLTVEGVFDGSLLRPIERLSTTSWPNMKFLEINLCITTPSGGWYFTKHDEVPFQPLYMPQSQIKTTHSDLHLEKFNFLKEAGYAYLDPVHVFRSKADDAELTPFIEAYAEALSMMPKLKSAALTVQLEDHIEGEPGWFCIAYFSPCKSAHDHPPRLICPRCNRGVTRQLVTSLLGWEPNEKLADKLRRTGAKFCTEPMVEKTMDEFRSYHGVEDDPN